MWDMYQRGVASGRERAAREQQQAARDAERAARWRLTENGHQVVQFGRYAYLWDGDQPLRLGDICQLPANWLIPRPTQAAVTGFGTDYDGRLTKVSALIERAAS
jgi:hypothetical protein